MCKFENAVEAVVPISDTNHLYELFLKVIHVIRELQTRSKNPVQWHSVLLHHRSVIGPDVIGTYSEQLFFHIRLIAEDNDALAMSISQENGLALFRNPKVSNLGDIAGVDKDVLTSGKWDYAWKILGAASEFSAVLAEAHPMPPNIGQIGQFLHFIVNPFGLGQAGILFRPGSFVNF